MKLYLIFYILLISSAQALNISITGQNSNKGSIALVVFSSADGFPKKSENAVFRSFVKVQDFPLSVKLKNGTYAISIFHDENNNKKLDTNFIGIPKEAFGFSNDVIGLMGPPTFEEAQFKVLNNNSSVTIKLKTFL